MNEKLVIIYFQITDLWKKFCEEHNELFHLTCDEYSLLLGSELELLDEKLREKDIVIQRIGALENIRKEIIDDINKIYPDRKIESVSSLLEFMQSLPIEKEQKHLFRFNALLIDIIEKIQSQDKRNQLFINKALISLKQIRIEASGKKNYSTYTSKGSAISSST